MILQSFFNSRFNFCSFVVFFIVICFSNAFAIEKTASKKRGKKAHEIFSPQALLNIAEGRKHRVYTPEGRAKVIETARQNGKKPKSEEWKRKMSERMKGIKRQTVACQHCGKECVLSNYNRWHGNNCKLKVDQT